MIDYVTREQFDVFLREEAEHHTRDEAYMHKVDVSVAAVGQQVAGLGTQLVASQRLIEKHHKDLYGNGEVGMDEKLRRIVDWVERQEKKEEDEEDARKEALKEQKELDKEKRDNQQFWIRFGITTVILNGLAVLGSIIIWLFKILPILNALQP